MKRSRNTRVYASIPKLHVKAANKPQYDESNKVLTFDSILEHDIEETAEETAEYEDHVEAAPSPEHEDMKETAEETAEYDDIEQTDKESESSSERMNEVSIC